MVFARVLRPIDRLRSPLLPRLVCFGVYAIMLIDVQVGWMAEGHWGRAIVKVYIVEQPRAQISWARRQAAREVVGERYVEQHLGVVDHGVEWLRHG